jgi:hypothetical protein
LIRLRVSGSTSLEIKVRASETGILVNKETTSKLTINLHTQIVPFVYDDGWSVHSKHWTFIVFIEKIF